MKLDQVMTKNVSGISVDATLREAARTMQKKDLGMLPAVADGNTLVGVLTDRDIVVRAVAAGRDPESTRVKDVMSPSLTCCYEDQSIQEAAELMQKAQLRRVLVLDREKHPVGIVSLGDLARNGAEEAMVRRTLERVSTPA